MRTSGEKGKENTQEPTNPASDVTSVKDPEEINTQKDGFCFLRS